ncbi:transcriptional repressor [Candidatus Gracilibacteria bacterium]|nr:transcriptional repressor [Candidatus Gracilibacteria bacterium]
MSDSRVTEPRKRFVELLSLSSRITFSDLRRDLVGKKGQPGMNLATLYRIVDTFKAQGLIHETTIAGERLIFACQCADGRIDDAVTISFCENCGAIYDTHTRISAQLTLSQTYQQTKSCSACVIR